MLYQVARTCTNEQQRWCVGNWPAQVSLMCLAEFVVLGSPSPPPLSHSSSVVQCILPTYPLAQSRHSACPGTYVWLREMLSCISSRMFDGALLCLNTDLDTTAERRLRICIHSPAAPTTCLLTSRIRQAALA